ncbi:MAG: TylF/MycF family methyltransferase [Planctomycetota bacterium]|nr:TylF/MycF family methyltransferase [Planctomycetota bacterium]
MTIDAKNGSKNGRHPFVRLAGSVARRAAGAIGLEIRKAGSTAGFNSYPPDFNETDLAIYEKVRDYTYTSPERVYAVCNAIRYLSARKIDGDIAECGVWRGGSMMAAMLTLLETGSRERRFFLYDTFEGMTEPTANDVSIAGRKAQSLFSEKQQRQEAWVAASEEDVRRNVASTGYPMSQVRFCKGKVEETLPARAPEKIALLRLDTDWYESTRHELEHLYDRLVPGGILIIDDYGEWLGARQAVDEFFAKTQPLLLNRIDYTGRIAVKA